MGAIEDTSENLEAAIQAHFAAIRPGILVTAWTMTINGTDGENLGTYTCHRPGQDHVLTWGLNKLGAKIQDQQMNELLWSGEDDE